MRYGEKWWESEDAMKLERGMSDEQIKAATHDLGCMMLYALPAKWATLLPCVEQGGCRTQGAF